MHDGNGQIVDKDVKLVVASPVVSGKLELSDGVKMDPSL